mmetsp:Transcript_12833/g.27268  ORF Transcript_12833/g.27268 Transcript_12833/m.27268 type:complete len:304 (-) Transcript_12833:82-993(-)
MGKPSRRRRLAITTSASVLLSAPFIGASALSSSLDMSSSDTSSAAMIGSSSSSHHALNTAFSCGTHWSTAETCSTLCPTGRDSDCPNGQQCYGGIPCSDSESSLHEILARQHHLEQQELNRLLSWRQETYVSRFVCGNSYAEAEHICARDADALTSSDSSSSSMDAAAQHLITLAASHYCPSGSSSQCSNGMECYAAVPCPRSAFEEEPSVSLTHVVPSDRAVDSFLITEPILWNVGNNNESSFADNDGHREGRRRRNTSSSSSASSSSSEEEFWNSFLRESSSSSIAGMMPLSSSSSHYGLN